MKSPTLLFLLSGSVLAVSHYLALEFSLYWRYVWLDVPIHFLGGATAMLGLFVLRDLKAPLPGKIYHFVPAIIYIVLVVLVWELFELAVGVPREKNYAFDTTLDIVMGIAGGLTGYFVAKNV